MREQAAEILFPQPAGGRSQPPVVNWRLCVKRSFYRPEGAAGTGYLPNACLMVFRMKMKSREDRTSPIRAICDKVSISEPLMP